MFDKKTFYNGIRLDTPIEKNSQVEGFEFILNEAIKRNFPRADLAYVLATVWWETGHTMQPVREAYWLSENWRKKNLRYYPFYGRGYVQLTWKENYQKATDKLKAMGYSVDFVNHPEEVLNPKYAVIILFVGMEEGWFTGHNLDDYIDDPDATGDELLREFVNARKIINGTDHDDEIAKIAKVYNKALKDAGYGEPRDPIRKPTAPLPVNPKATPPDLTKVGVGVSAATILGALALSFIDQIESFSHYLWSVLL